MGKHRHRNRSNGSYVTTESSYVTPCHSGNIQLFDDPKSPLTFHGGGASKDATIYSDWITIDLAGVDPPVIMIYGGLKMPELIQHTQERVLRIYWPDMGIPTLDAKAWELLIRELRAEAGRLVHKNERQNVLVICQGGHGRTGTALSILAALILGEKEPVKFVRENYCEECVESIKQIDYIREITGLPLVGTSPRSVKTGIIVYQNGRYGTYKYGDGLGNTVNVGSANEKGGDKTGRDYAEFSRVICKNCGGPTCVYGAFCVGCNKPVAGCDCARMPAYI